MADVTILNGDIGVTWLDSNRGKYLEWIGGTNSTYTMNELYSAMQTLQDEPTTVDDGTCFFADTPLEYTIGLIDQGDNDPWYIQFDLMEKITGGALRTSGWTRVTSSNTGIIVVPGTNTNFVKADEGETVTGGTTGSGTLLEVISSGSGNDYLVIRPDDATAASDFVTASQTITGSTSGHTFTQWGTASSTTGEQIWANIYSIGTIEPTVHMYIYQGAALTTDARNRVFSWNDSTKDWYGNGQIDTTIALKDIESTTWSIIDGGYVTVYARKGGDFYSSFEVANSTTSGGRNPAPINTSVDADQSHGTKVISFTGAITGTFSDGEVIEGGTSGGRGILDLTNSTLTSGGELVYFPIAEDAIGGSLVPLQSGEVITGALSGATCTTDGAPADDGPASSTWFTNSGTPPTISFGFATADIDNDGTDEYYGVTIDCNQNPLTEVYQWLKYITQYGQISGGVVETGEPGIDGQEYIGATAYFEYASISGTIAEGESVTQATTGATGVILSHDTVNQIVLLRSTRGSFQSGLQIDADDDADFFGAGSLVASNFAANASAPFGTLPGGGTFFGARGVLITDYVAADENRFSLIDIEGVTNVRPQSITLAITNLVGTAETSNEADLVSMFRLTGSGGDVDKSEYNVTGTPAAGDATLAVVETITDDTPTSGRLMILVNPGSADADEYTVRFSSWSGSTFTLANTTGTATAGTGDTTLIDSGASFNTTARRGDLVYTAKGIAYVETVDSDTQLTLQGLGISGLVSTDAYELNAVPVALDTGDDVYVPFIHRYATTSEESTSIIYVSQIYYRVKVRNSRNTTTKIRPFSADGTTTGSNVSVQITRNADTIIT